MKWSPAILAMLACTILTSCVTPALWRATNPHEFVAVTRNKVNEDELKASGLSYWVDPKRSLFYVEKTNLQKAKDYIIRAVGTPVTVAVDAATTIAVVGAVVFVMRHADAQDMQASSEIGRASCRERV